MKTLILRTAEFAAAQNSPLRWGYDRLVGKSPRLSILFFHRVIHKPDPFAMSPLSAAYFEDFLTRIKKIYHVQSLQQAMLDWDLGKLHPRSLCLTFDDGYRDNYDVAFPILKRLDLTATIFLATDLIGTGELSWYDKVLEAFRTATAQQIEIPEIGLKSELGEQPQQVATFAFKVLEGLKTLPNDVKQACITTLIRDLKPASSSQNRMMLNWDEVQAMDKAGIGIGAHTCSHPILSKVDDAQVDSEIRGSRDMIEKHLNKPVTLFAYPNGQRQDFDERAKEALRRNGFKMALTTVSGVNSMNQDRLELKRLQPWDLSPRTMAGRMALELAKS